MSNNRHSLTFCLYFVFPLHSTVFSFSVLSGKMCHVGQSRQSRFNVGWLMEGSDLVDPVQGTGTWLWSFDCSTTLNVGFCAWAHALWMAFSSSQSSFLGDWCWLLSCFVCLFGGGGDYMMWWYMEHMEIHSVGFTITWIRLDTFNSAWSYP